MSVLSDADKCRLIEQSKQYDFIRLCWPDIHGIPRGKTVIGHYAENAIKRGFSIYSGEYLIYRFNQHQ